MGADMFGVEEKRVVDQLTRNRTSATLKIDALPKYSNISICHYQNPLEKLNGTLGYALVCLLSEEQAQRLQQKP